ncbi:MAG: haloacid dehalogenase type II [Pseudomonadota bacterium]
MTPSSIRALTFDVFGTVVDWRGSIIREGRALGKQKNLKVDWAAVADAWRDGYKPAMDRVRKRQLPWMSIDQLHRLILDDVLAKLRIDGVTPQDKDHLNHAWHRLRPWPDALRGIRRLKKRYIVATLSNGNMSLLVDMARNAGLPWDCVLSAELFRHYKPDPEAYLGAAALLGLQPSEVLMVAAHKDDLQAAKRCGLRTAFVRRPMERGPGAKADLSSDRSFDFNADDFNDLASRLHA